MFSYGKGKMTTKRAIRGKVIRWHGSTVRAETRSPKRSRNTGGRKKEDESRPRGSQTAQNPNCAAGRWLTMHKT